MKAFLDNNCQPTEGLVIVKKSVSKYLMDGITNKGCTSVKRAAVIMV